METEIKILKDKATIQKLKEKGWKVKWLREDGLTSLYFNEHGFLRINYNSSYPKHVIEARNDDGSLNFDGEQPPSWVIGGITEDQLIRRIFWADPANKDKPGDIPSALDYIASKGWAIRAKTW